MRSYKTIVVITLSKALWGKGVLRQVLKEAWLKGERGHIVVQYSYLGLLLSAVQFGAPSLEPHCRI